MAAASTSVATIGPSTSQPPPADTGIEAFLQLETVGISTLCDLSLVKLSSEDEKPVVGDAIYRCRLCTRIDGCAVRGKKMLSSKASRLHYAAHMLTYKALLRFESPEVLCPVCGTLIFTAGSGEPLIELELINHIESEHAEIVLKELSPASLTPLQCGMMFRICTGAIGTGEKLQRKNYAYCLLCKCDIFKHVTFRTPHCFEWMIEDHVVSHLSTIVDFDPELTYRCAVCPAEPFFDGASLFLQHIFTRHRKRLTLACFNNKTEYLWNAYNNLYIRIYGILAPLAYRVVHGGTLNPFDSRDGEEDAGSFSVSRKYYKKKKIAPKVPMTYVNCKRAECGHEKVEEEDVAMVKHMILHVKHDEHRMKHHKEGTAPVWCCPKADKIFTTGGLLTHFVSAHFYDNEKVDVLLFNFVMTRCKDILKTIVRDCFGNRDISPFKVMALLIDLDVCDSSISLWMSTFSDQSPNETFVELWLNVIGGRNLDAEDSDYICYALPFISEAEEDNDEIVWVDSTGSEIQKSSEEDSDVESTVSEGVPKKCEIVPMLEIVVSVRRFRYELRENLPVKETVLLDPPLQRKRRLNPKRMPLPESIVVELREGREIDPFNLTPSEPENLKQSDDSDVEVLPAQNRPTRCGRRPMYDHFSPSESIRLTTSGQMSSNGIAMGQLASKTVKEKKPSKPYASRARTESRSEKRSTQMKDRDATKKLDSALENFICDTVNSIMPEETRSSVQRAIYEPSPPKMTLHELIMEQIEKDMDVNSDYVPSKRKRGRPRKIEAAG
ncbi:hypothetical protein QR680_008708 [Steinernema hermaphroditum]|uniref:Uncharacterized protein n=1 Tax=Steinernema hermaphroditum TaxID=289476 RepID=A0AA39M856_9BILA|nr:hypothetical protein QR680_008708 [Steinernema hermaphroditum]